MEGLPFFCQQPPMTSILHGPTGCYYETGIINRIVSEDNPKKLQRLIGKHPNLNRNRIGHYLEYAIYYHKYNIVPLLARFRSKEDLVKLLQDCIKKPDLVAVELILCSHNCTELYHQVMLTAPEFLPKAHNNWLGFSTPIEVETVNIADKLLLHPYFTSTNKELLLKYLIDTDTTHRLIYRLINSGVSPPLTLGNSLSHIPIIQYLFNHQLPILPGYITNLSLIIPLRYMPRKLWSEVMLQLSTNPTYTSLFNIFIDSQFTYPVMTLAQALAYLDLLLIPPYSPGSKEWKETKDHFELTTGKLSEQDNKLGYPELIVRANYHLLSKVDKECVIQRIPQLSKSDLLKIIHQL